MRKCLFYVLLLGVSFIGLSGVLSSNANAISDIDNKVTTTDNLTLLTTEGTHDMTSDWYPYVINILEKWRDTQGDAPKYQAILDKLQDNVILHNTGWAVMQNQYNGFNIMIFDQDSEINFGEGANGNSWHYYTYPKTGGITVIEVPGHNQYLKDNVWMYTTIIANETTNIEGFANGYFYFYQSGSSSAVRPFLEIASNKVNYPVGYEGITVPKSTFEPPAEESNWKPDIKLHQGSNWLVELSDYNFYTTDMNLPFLCGPDELAPVIDWEVWDITDDENRVLIDTLSFGAPALVEYQAPKIQEDKRYEIVAYYWGCEGMEFTEASTKQFTVRKDGSLNPTDFMVVCLRPDFPFIHVPDCLAEVNDYLAMMSFRLVTKDSIGGGTFNELATGCRELQVLDDWLMKPDQVVCPMFSSTIRNTITPFIVFSAGLMVATFISKRQGSV